MLNFHCVICLNSGGATNGLIDSPMATPCGHIFHKKCLMRWIHSRKIEAIEAQFDDDPDDFDLRCPMCNVIFDEEDCIRLYPVESESVAIDKDTQTLPGLDEGQNPNYAGLLEFIQRKLQEKWNAEREVQVLQETLRRLTRMNMDLEGKCEHLKMCMDLLAEVALRSNGCTCGGEKKKGKIGKMKAFIVKGFQSFLNPGEFHHSGV